MITKILLKIFFAVLFYQSFLLVDDAGVKDDAGANEWDSIFDKYSSHMSVLNRTFKF